MNCEMKYQVLVMNGRCYIMFQWRTVRCYTRILVMNIKHWWWTMRHYFKYCMVIIVKCYLSACTMLIIQWRYVIDIILLKHWLKGTKNGPLQYTIVVSMWIIKMYNQTDPWNCLVLIHYLLPAAWKLTCPCMYTSSCYKKSICIQ